MVSPLRVLFATAEAYPLMKTGGLGDVGGSLPPALRELDVDARILLPAYPGVLERIRASAVSEPFVALAAAPPVRLYQGTLPEGATPVYALHCPALYEREGSPYVDEEGRDWADNVLRFGILSRVAALFGTGEGLAGWWPQVIHCNDWQTGLTPAYLAHAPQPAARSLMSVHNMAFQGNFPSSQLPALGLPWSAFSIHGVEFHGHVSFLKAGLFYADHLTAVSPTYAREIQTPEFGYGMQGLLVERRHQLTGIMNGIDTRSWNPASDPHLVAPYSSEDLSGKALNKQALQERMGLAATPGMPLVGMVSRMTWQKGIDLVLDTMGRLLDQPLQVAVLGNADDEYGHHCERRWRQLAGAFPGRVAAEFRYDEALSHLLEAGADMFLMPSRFEPCGLNQMYSMAYGTLPLVRHTGGLADSVVDTTPRTLSNGTATGFVFHLGSEGELLACALRALCLYRDQNAWRMVQTNGMRKDFSWRASAAQYLEIYRRLAG